jgi:uncharacterized protein (DUF2252 family)
VAKRERLDRAPHSPAERREHGKATRARAPRSSHAEWQPPAERPGPVEVLRSQDVTREPDLVPVRYGRMLASPFTFFRGAAAIMAQDLAATPGTGLEAQLCGDAHLSNFGVFQAPDRSLVFDLNDFDETLPGPFEWDLKRLAASLAVAGRERGFKRSRRRQVVLASVRRYREAMRDFAGRRDIEVWYARLDIVAMAERWRSHVSRERARRFERNVKKARNKDSLRAVAKLTEGKGEELRIARRPPLLVPIEDLVPKSRVGEIQGVVTSVLASYLGTLAPDVRHLADGYRYVHAARKVVGVGSVGNRAWIALLLGRDADDPLFLQFKEAQSSVLEPFAGRSRYRQHGRRVVEGQRLMQAAGDQLLGWMTAQGLDGERRDFYVRQLWDGKGSAEVELMSPRDLQTYAEVCGWTLARAHARSGDRIAIASYLGSGEVFDRAIADFAEGYADQNETDYELVTKAAESGQIEVRPGL